jgi:hypothetical protein
MDRQPFIVGPAADCVLGFFAGFFGTVLGLLATIVVMFLWAGSEPGIDVAERRRHAWFVSAWSGVGCVAPIVLVILVFSAVISSQPMTLP